MSNVYWLDAVSVIIYLFVVVVCIYLLFDVDVV